MTNYRPHRRPGPDQWELRRTCRVRNERILTVADYGGDSGRRFVLDLPDRRVQIFAAEGEVVGRSAALEMGLTNGLERCEVVLTNSRIVLAQDVVA